MRLFLVLYTCVFFASLALLKIDGVSLTMLFCFSPSLVTQRTVI